MAKPRNDKKLYRRMRASGVRKKVARELTELPAHVKGGKQAPKPLREAVDRLETTVTELREHIGHGDRKTAARKAARTRRAKTKERRASARKGARSRAKA
jgi:hypothetical protein